MNLLFSNGRIRVLPSLSLLLLCISGFAALAIFVSPASASIINGLIAAPTSTHENVWAVVEIAKPTYTFFPTATQTPIPTDTPAPTFTETPGVMGMEVLVDTAVPIYEKPEPIDASSSSYTYSGSKYILVDISEQHMYVYDGSALIYSFVSSTGMNNATRVGTFAVQSKIPNAYGATWNIWMPNWLGIYWAGGLENGIHALPILPNGATLWAGFLGRPISYGCVVLDTYDSKLLYDWAEVGTPVEIQW